MGMAGVVAKMTCSTCTALNKKCLAHRSQPARVWPLATIVTREGACGECGAPMRPCLIGFRCMSSECGAIAHMRGR